MNQNHDPTLELVKLLTQGTDNKNIIKDLVLVTTPPTKEESQKFAQLIKNFDEKQKFVTFFDFLKQS